MNSIIQLLPEQLINQIAAGEVVQRPASVIKELLENSIDAGATSIEVILKDAGKTLIQVIDNGKGMSPMDATMSFERHTTSKIKTTNDLFNLTTLGFRGEALASISSVAQVTLLTRTEEQELGTIVEIEGNKLKKNEPIICAKGSNLSVKNLFFNVPARRNFLKSNAVEIKHLLNEFIHIALCHPEIVLKFTHQDQLIFDLTSTNLGGRIQQIYDGISAKDLLILNEETTAVNFYGYVGAPSISKNARGEQFFFVNNRFVRSNYLNHAVQTAFESLIPKGHFPFFVLFIHLDPSKIDINIHPTKTEVKFEDERLIYSYLLSSIKKALGAFHQMPIIKEDTVMQEMLKNAPEIIKDETIGQFAKNNFNLNNQSNTNSFKQEPTKWNWKEFYKKPVYQQHIPQAQTIFSQPNSKNYFQIFQNFIAFEKNEEFYLINQVYAHQRIIFEKIVKQKHSIAIQQLLYPHVMDLSHEEFVQLQEVENEIIKMGFSFELSGNKIVITGIPATMKFSEVQSTFDAIIKSLKEVDFVKNDIFEKLASLMARQTAIKSNQKLQDEEMESIVNQLFQCEDSQYSPIGKKIIQKFPKEMMSKWFE